LFLTAKINNNSESTKQFIQEKSSLLYLFLLEKHHFRNLFVFLQRNAKNAIMKTTSLNEAQMSILRLLGSILNEEIG
jgi:regulator of sirC expression with transglutaminase-like and TPR domain